MPTERMDISSMRPMSTGASVPRAITAARPSNWFVRVNAAAIFVPDANAHDVARMTIGMDIAPKGRSMLYFEHVYM